jgi:hypothetical protein
MPEKLNSKQPIKEFHSLYNNFFKGNFYPLKHLKQQLNKQNVALTNPKPPFDILLKGVLAKGSYSFTHLAPCIITT